MVESKIKGKAYFLAFILPCLVLYLIFCITPFIRGVFVSFTNWDGLATKSPIDITKEQYEGDILSKLSEKDQLFLNKYYKFNQKENTYHRGFYKNMFVRTRMERLFKKAGWVNPNYKNVGLDNYKKIFTGKAGKDFYPRIMEIQYFSERSTLPVSIDAKVVNKKIFPKMSALDKAQFLKAYSFVQNDEVYKRSPEYNESALEKKILNIPSIKANVNLDVDSYITQVKQNAMEFDVTSIRQASSSFASENNLTEAEAQDLTSSAEKFVDIAQVKKVLAKSWVSKRLNMGVIGFTAFFAIFSVIGINLLAFLLALALDAGIKGQKYLRTIFFIPNVLSMVIVALIWSMLFVQLLPAITGVKEWLSDANKTPWLLVLVAIWQGCGYYMIIYLAGLQNIPSELIEAAKIDGATWWDRFKSITLPLLAPSITISLFLSISNALKSFDLIYAMINNSGYAYGTVPFVMDIYFDAYGQKQAGFATAKAMVLFVVILIITGTQLVLSKRKEIHE